MKNSKILMSLVAASIAAMAAAPELLKSEANDHDGKQKDLNKKLINLNDKNVQLTAEQEELSKDAENQVGAILSKKAPIMKVSESVSILVDNYGSDDESIKEKIYKDLQLTQTDDSTLVKSNAALLEKKLPGKDSNTVQVCHSACHGACHVACHGSRGWR